MPPKTSEKRKRENPKPEPELVPINDDPFCGAFDASWEDESVTQGEPPGMRQELDKVRHKRVDVLGDISVVLDITFEDEVDRATGSVRMPIGNLLNERVKEQAKIHSMGWQEPRVHTWTTGPDGEKKLGEMRRFKTKADGHRVVLSGSKYILVDASVLADDSDTGGRIYQRNDGVWRVCDIMTAILDFERRVRPKTEWFGGIDAHHVYLDYVECKNGIVSYGFGS